MFLYFLDSDTAFGALSPIIVTRAHNARVRAKWSVFYVSENKKAAESPRLSAVYHNYYQPSFLPRDANSDGVCPVSDLNTLQK